MKHKFSLVYELDCPVAIAVATYLDAEHYVFLHRKYATHYEILDTAPHKVKYRITWHFLGFRIGQVGWAEYAPPADFLNYAVKPDPWWFPSIHHICRINTHLKYTPVEGKNATLSTLDVEVDMPFWLWPMRHRIQRAIERLKKEKDWEDVEMIEYRAKLFGRENNNAYLREDQFLLHKDDYVKHFGKNSVPLT